MNDGTILLKTIKAYMKVKPFFYGYIRPQEAYFFKKSAKYIKAPVLDFGCDDGFFAALCLPTPLEYGLDLPGTGVEGAAAKKVYKKLVVYEGGKIPLPNNCVNTVVSNCVFEHVTDMELSLREMHRILKPGGYLLTSVMKKNWETNLFGVKIFGEIYAKWLAKKQVHLNLFTKSEWESLYKKLNFDVVSVDNYLHAKIAYQLEIAHYKAIPQLINFKLRGKWNITNNIKSSENAILETEKQVKDDLKEKNEGAAAFYVLRKAMRAKDSLA